MSINFIENNAKFSHLTVTSADGGAPTRKLKCSSVERDTGGNFSRVIAQVNYEW